MPAVALPSALSCLDSRADMTLALHPTPTLSCSGSTLGVPLRGWSRTAASAWVRPPGSHQAPWHWSEVSQGWIPGRAAADQRLALSLPQASSQRAKPGQGFEGGGRGGSQDSQGEVLPVRSGKD